MGVIIGMDPHQRSATIELIDDRAQVLAAGRFGMDRAGYAEMLKAGRKFGARLQSRRQVPVVSWAYR